MAAALIYSCSKENEKTNFTYDLENNELKMSDDDIAIMNKIIEFRDKAALVRENPDTLSSELYSPEDAIWNIETFFNVTYGFPDNTYGKTKADTLLVNLPLNPYGKVLLSDIVDVYDEIVVKTSRVYHASDFVNKRLLLMNISYSEPDNNILQLTLRIVIGETRATPPEPPAQWQPFEDGDNWLFGFLWGKCDGTQSDTSDAAKELRELINGTIFYIDPLPPAGYRKVWVYDDPIILVGNEYQNQYGENLIFYIEKEEGISEGDRCIEYPEMNFHYTGELEVILNIISIEYQKPDNWLFMHCFIDGVEDYLLFPEIHRIRHENVLTYAYRYLVPVADIPLPVEIPNIMM